MLVCPPALALSRAAIGWESAALPIELVGQQRHFTAATGGVKTIASRARPVPRPARLPGSVRPGNLRRPGVTVLLDCIHLPAGVVLAPPLVRERVARPHGGSQDIDQIAVLAHVHFQEVPAVVI